MPIRPFKLSTDLRICTEILPTAFQYPENPSWNMQDDEAENLVGLLSGVARIWPVVRLAQIVFPMLRDYVRGFMWEEDDQPAGAILLNRQGTTNTWEIVRVAVLPEHRRKGIGRQLVETSIDYIRGRGAKVVVLDMIAGNTPAYEMYKHTGFVPFATYTAFDYTKNEPPTKVAQPEECTMSEIGPADWRHRYELALRTIPADVQRYDPIQEEHYRSTLPGRLATGIANLASATQEKCFAVHAAGGQVIAVVDYSVRMKPGGVNRIGLRVDLDHTEIAAYLLHSLIRTTQSLSPGRRIEFTVPHWQGEVMEAASAAGCVKHLEYHTMGMLL
jgi:GNAT superfamily N-acetyltransferase